MAGDQVPEIVLESVDAPRRAFLKKLILGSAFVAPSVASFAMSGLSIGEAASVNVANQTCAGGNFSGQNLQRSKPERLHCQRRLFQWRQPQWSQSDWRLPRRCPFRGRQTQ